MNDMFVYIIRVTQGGKKKKYQNHSTRKLRNCFFNNDQYEILAFQVSPKVFWLMTCHGHSQ